MNVQPQNQPIDLAHEAAFALGGMEVRPATREAVAGGVSEDLEPRVMQVLVALNRRRGEVVSRDELILSCWGGRAVGDDAINRCIARIRRLSESHGGFSVETIPRVGYRLNESPQGPGIPISDTAPAGFAARHRALLAGLLVLVAGLVFALAFLPVGKAPMPNAVPQRLPSKLTIAVLPFTALSGEAGDERLGMAIASRAADMLVESPFEIVAPARALQYGGAAKAGAAQALKADLLFDGDIRRSQGVVDVEIRVIDGHSNSIVVATTQEFPATDADNIADELAAKISDPLLLPRPSTGRDARVVAALWRASIQLGVRRDYNGANETAREAAQVAPDDAFAQALHGLTAAYLAGVMPPEQKPAMLAEARAAAERAARLDPGYGDPHAVLGMVEPAFDWGSRETQFRQGLAISQDAQTAEISLIDLLQNVGRFRDSAPPAQNLFTRGSRQVAALVGTIDARLWQGQDIRALITDAGNRIRFWTLPWFAAKLFEEAAFQGGPGDAEALMREPGIRNILDQEGRPTFSRIALALHDRHPQDIQAVVDDCAKPDGLGPEAKRTCFLALAVLGRLDDAFRLADRFYPDQRGATLQLREARPGFEIPPAYLSVAELTPLRADPRFRDVAERIGLLNYWKSSHHAPDFCMTEKTPVCALLHS